MASPLPYAGSIHPHPTPLDMDDLSQPLHRIDQAHQLLADIDEPAEAHREPIVAHVPGSMKSMAKESPTTDTVTEVSPRQAYPQAAAVDRHRLDLNDTSNPLDGDDFEPAWIPERMLQAHAEDLIAFLQSWSDDLDQRSAKLNADIATQERRERSFRLWMQQRRAEIEAEQTLKQQEQTSRQAAARRAFFEATDSGRTF